MRLDDGKHIKAAAYRIVPDPSANQVLVMNSWRVQLMYIYMSNNGSSHIVLEVNSDSLPMPCNVPSMDVLHLRTNVHGDSMDKSRAKSNELGPFDCGGGSGRKFSAP
jgi:hypothetical protein